MVSWNGSRVGLLTTALCLCSGIAMLPNAVSRADSSACSGRAATINPESVIRHSDCTLYSNDLGGLNFGITYWTPGNGVPPLSTKVTVTDAAGKELQIINELLEVSSPAPVGLQDIDGDGRDDLIIPIAQRKVNGVMNTQFSAWRADGASRHYERVQMLGQAVYRSGDGYVVTNSGGLSSRDLDFYLPTTAGFTHIVTITIAAEDVDFNTHHVLTVSCVAHKQSGLQAIDMDYTESPVFCDSPAARAIWPDAVRI